MPSTNVAADAKKSQVIDLDRALFPAHTLERSRHFWTLGHLTLVNYS